MDLCSDDQDLICMIYILDMEYFWDLYFIFLEYCEVIICLEWDQLGFWFLLVDVDGQIKCWSMVDYLVNSWESLVGSLVEGDFIVVLFWLYNGVKLVLYVEKLGVFSFGEKFF